VPYRDRRHSPAHGDRFVARCARRRGARTPTFV
jgi:hypothetical protein